MLAMNLRKWQESGAGLTRHVEEDDAWILADFVGHRAPVEGVGLGFLNLQGAHDFLEKNRQ